MISASSLLRRRTSTLLTLAVAAMATTAAHAGIITVPALSTTYSFELGTNGNLPGWTNGTDGHGNNAYNLNFASATAAKTTGAVDEYNTIHNPDHVVLDSAVTADAKCPSCAILGMDSDYHTGPVSASISGLTVGDLETVSFDFAGAQQTGFSGSSTDFLAVTFGGITKDTGSVNVASQGFSGWTSESFTFTATSANETLSFLAGGTTQNNGNEPAFALMDDLQISQATPTSPVPEPNSLMLLSTGLMGLGGLVRSRIAKKA